MKFRGVIFDWAGTTVDYGCMAPVAAFKAAFQRFQMEVSLAEIRKPMGMLKKDHIKALLEVPQIAEQWNKLYGSIPDSVAIEDIYQVFEQQLFKDLAQFVKPKPGVIDVVHELREQRIKIGSTTGYTSDMMEIVAHEAQKHGYAPDTYVTPDQVNNFGRPYPYMIFENMKRLQIQSVTDVLKVGDTLSDIQEGKNAGMPTVGIIEGSSLLGLALDEYEDLSSEQQIELKAEVRELYWEAGADFVVNDITEILALI